LEEKARDLRFRFTHWVKTGGKGIFKGVCEFKFQKMCFFSCLLPGFDKEEIPELENA